MATGGAAVEAAALEPGAPWLEGVPDEGVDAGLES
jgi:hypothetical protein